MSEKENVLSSPWKPIALMLLGAAGQWAISGGSPTRTEVENLVNNRMEPVKELTTEIRGLRVDVTRLQTLHERGNKP